ncbi:MAG TPA: carboxyl transferase domain-containing protein [Terriglobales bacterium]|jgi:acetyl/propionyl-CoA carboxylase alpha subunit/acetyl-CoA carboxylase carboxyltransferase component
MSREFQRVAMVDRGDAAMRFIRAVRELNHETNGSLRTIALYTDGDRDSRFVREADESVRLGPVQVPDLTTDKLRSVHASYTRVEQALVEAHADALWVGWGFIGNHIGISEVCRKLGILFIGPTVEGLRRLSDKITAKILAEQLNIPVVPWSERALDTLEEAAHEAQRIGYPVLVKSTTGHSGQGIHRVDSDQELHDGFELARTQAQDSFGDPTVFLEKLVPNARLISIPIITDQVGTTWTLGTIDTLIQHDNLKVLIECPAAALSSEQEGWLREASRNLCEVAGYRNAGTLEFLYEPVAQQLLFLEMNSGFAPEHSVAESVIGVDLVKLQLQVALGHSLGERPPQSRGHSISIIVQAGSNTVRDSLRLARFRMASSHGVRIDSAVNEGEVFSAKLDPVIARITVCGRDRIEAFSRLQSTLRESVVVVDGSQTDKSLWLELLEEANLQNGIVDSKRLPQFSEGKNPTPKKHAEIALIAAALEAYESELAIELAQFYASAERGRPRARSEVGHTIELCHCGHSYTLETYRIGARRYRVNLDGAIIEAAIERLNQYESWLVVFGERYHIVANRVGQEFVVDVNGISHWIGRDDSGIVRAPSPTVVVSIAVKPGDIVAAGDHLAVLEAMKMEMDLIAPFAGRVRRVMTMPNVQVDTGAALLQIDPTTSQTSPQSDRIVLPSAILPRATDSTIANLRHALSELKQFMLGFDVDVGQANRSLTRQQSSATRDGVQPEEDEILSIFVDMCSLFHRTPIVDEPSGVEVPSPETHLFNFLSFLRSLDSPDDKFPTHIKESLKRILGHYGITTLVRTPRLEEALFWVYKSHQRFEQHVAPMLCLLERRLIDAKDQSSHASESFRELLDKLITTSREMFPTISDLAREVRYQQFDKPVFEKAREEVYSQMEKHLSDLDANRDAPDREERMRAMVECPQPMLGFCSARFRTVEKCFRQLMLEVLTRRYYRIRNIKQFTIRECADRWYASAQYEHHERQVHLFTTHVEYAHLSAAAESLFPMLNEIPASDDVVVDFYVVHPAHLGDSESTQSEICNWINQLGFPRTVSRIVVAIAGNGDGMGCMQHFTYRHNGNAYEEVKLYRGIHPMIGKRLHLWRLSEFDIERLPSVEDVYLLRAVAKANPKDERLFGCAEIRDLTPVRDALGRIVHLPHLERMFMEAVGSMRAFQARRKPHQRLHWNRILLYVWPALDLNPDELGDIIRNLALEAEGIGLEQVVIRGSIPNPDTGQLRDMVVRVSRPCGGDVKITFRPATKLLPVKPFTEYEQKVVRMRQRGMIYPYEIIKLLTPSPDDASTDFPAGEFTEYDLDSDGAMIPVIRPYGQNKSNIIVGVIRNFTKKYPEGMTRVFLAGDPSRDLGALAEPECCRIIEALNLAETMRVPVEWFPVSAGAKISMESGVENMDWIARVLRRLIEFTQAGGEVNLLINGINVGAQPYWNAEATMLMHTRGILVMTPKAAMVLTGKRALEYSGSVSAEDNQGIGGYDRIMGVNGQAQYWAKDINEAGHILLRHYEHTYLANGERFPRRAATIDARDRDVREYPHCTGNGTSFTRVGDIFSNEANPARKKSFDIRRVMLAVTDQDHSPLERWSGMRAAETAVVWDAHIGGYPVCLIGMESRPIPRLGFVPADGPDSWTAGTLFPQSSKKVARAINAASNNRPIVMLANLSGFDGSPESMRRLQLEYGAEIGRAVVNFKGPIVFCVVSRYHGGAYVVFSRALNEQLEVVALEGTYASVIGGAPAAGVVFASEVEARTRKDPRLQALEQSIAKTNKEEQSRLRAQFNELYRVIHSENLGTMAEEFDRIHNVHRALKVGALNKIIPPASLRPYLIDALERGIAAEEKLEVERLGGDHARNNLVAMGETHDTAKAS